MRRFKQYNDNSLNDSFLQEVNSKGKPIGKPISKKQKGKIYNDIEGFINNSNNSNYQLFGGSGQRMAGQILIPSPELKELLMPWSAYDRDRNLENFIGRNESAWKQDNREIRDELIDIDTHGSDRQDLKRLLQDKGFLQEEEQEAIIKNLYNPRYRGRLHTEVVGVPRARADEELSQAVLQYSGFRPVKLENSGDPMSTDLSAYIDGATRYVDAQSRIRSKGMDVEITKFNPNAYEVIKDNPGLALIDLTKKIKEQYPSIVESKFLQTFNPEFNKIMGYKMRNNPDYVKDYLISSDRRGMRSHSQGPYDRTLPRGWDLVDLNRARELLLPLTQSQMYDKYGVELTKGNRSQNPILELPDEFIKKYLTDTNNGINPEVIKALTQ